MSRYRPHAGIDPAAMCLVLSVTALGHTLQISNGFYHPTAIAWLSAALALCVAGVLWLRPSAACAASARLPSGGPPSVSPPSAGPPSAGPPHAGPPHAGSMILRATMAA